MGSKVEKRLGERVAAFRRSAGLTQEGLGERVRIAPETISRLERGVTIPSIVTLSRIGEALGIELRDFFDFKSGKSAKDRAIEEFVLDLKRCKVDEIGLIHDVAKRFFQHLGKSNIKQ